MSQRTLSERELNSSTRTHRRRDDRIEGEETVFFNSFDPFGVEAEQEFKINVSRREKCTLTGLSSFIRTPSTGSPWPGHEQKDCIFGRRCFTLLFVTLQCFADCFEKWYPWEETRLFQRVPMPCPAPETVLKDAGQLSYLPWCSSQAMNSIDPFTFFHQTLQTAPPTTTPFLVHPDY